MKKRYDVITLSHVIEHVHDPYNTLKNCYDLLSPGGLLFIDTPNIDARSHRRFKENWRGLEAPRHLVIFNWESIFGVLKRCGFERIEPLVSPTPYA